ncbi:MAG: hypothetical protein PHE17_08435 [Thiothrix sp.]|uniref:hypothetical protein n=1 Tax=Thiothrix sp. TaxID=1032 RepID=UPI00262EEC60|nr:hypothetical protein [Thiothrix sp.]MDD5393028.1 hypothetical protein [Thiothrix sp.]
MYMQLNEQFIVDERGSKQAVIIPFAKYLKIMEIIRRHDEPTETDNCAAIWQTNKGSAQAVKAWLASDTYKQYPMGNPEQIDRTVQEIRDAWGDE